MRKFVVVNKSRAERVVCCEDPSAIVLKSTDSLIEVDIARKVFKGEQFLVDVRVTKFNSKYVPYIIGAVVLLGALGFYFWG